MGSISIAPKKANNKKNIRSLSSYLDQYIYYNIKSDSTVRRLKTELKNKTGIYCIKHVNSGKVYIGSSFNLARRLTDHVYNRSSNAYLQRAFNKYGLDQFYISILELIPTVKMSKEGIMLALIELEQKYIDMHPYKYNINPMAGKTRLGSKHTAKTKALFSKIRKINPSFLNKTHSAEYKEQLRARMLGDRNHMFGKPVTEENKLLISKFFSKKTYIYDVNGTKLIKVFDKHKDLATEFNMSSKTIVKYKDSGLAFRNKYLITSVLLDKEHKT